MSQDSRRGGSTSRRDSLHRTQACSRVTAYLIPLEVLSADLNGTSKVLNLADETVFIAHRLVFVTAYLIPLEVLSADLNGTSKVLNL